MNKMKTFEDCLEASLEIMYKDEEKIKEMESLLIRAADSLQWKADDGYNDSLAMEIYDYLKIK